MRYTMSKAFKIREVWEQILEKECDEVDIHKDILDIIAELKDRVCNNLIYYMLYFFGCLW